MKSARIILSPRVEAAAKAQLKVGVKRDLIFSHPYAVVSVVPSRSAARMDFASRRVLKGITSP